MKKIDTRKFIQEKFTEYYREHSLEIEPPSSIERREFGFFLFKDKFMLRHKAFRNADELRDFLKKRVPSDTFFSSAYYEKPKEEMAEKEVRAIVDKIIEMGDGDVVVGSIKAVEAGVLDSPFAANINVKDNVMGVRDIKGACRFLEIGNLPMPDDVKEFHRSKVAEREAAEGIKMDYNVSLKDFWAFSKGTIKGIPPYTL